MRKRRNILICMILCLFQPKNILESAQWTSGFISPDNLSYLWKKYIYMLNINHWTMFKSVFGVFCYWINLTSAWLLKSVQKNGVACYEFGMLNVIWLLLCEITFQICFLCEPNVLQSVHYWLNELAPVWYPPFLQKVSKYLRDICNIGSLPVQSPTTNIVYRNFGTGYIRRHQTLSFPLQTEINSHDKTGISNIVWQPTGKKRQTRKDRAFHTDH